MSSCPIHSCRRRRSTLGFAAIVVPKVWRRSWKRRRPRPARAAAATKRRYIADASIQDPVAPGKTRSAGAGEGGVGGGGRAGGLPEPGQRRGDVGRHRDGPDLAALGPGEMAFAV